MEAQISLPYSQNSFKVTQPDSAEWYCVKNLNFSHRRQFKVKRYVRFRE
jgi:hypothetical protein